MPWTHLHATTPVGPYWAKIANRILVTFRMSIFEKKWYQHVGVAVWLLLRVLLLRTIREVHHVPNGYLGESQSLQYLPRNGFSLFVRTNPTNDSWNSTNFKSDPESWENRGPIFVDAALTRMNCSHDCFPRNNHSSWILSRGIATFFTKPLCLCINLLALFLH
jgi:hypothetical protein